MDNGGDHLLAQRLLVIHQVITNQYSCIYNLKDYYRQYSKMHMHTFKHGTS